MTTVLSKICYSILTLISVIKVPTKTSLVLPSERDLKEQMDLKIIDLSSYLFMSGEDTKVRALCKEVSSNLREKGAILVKDPRCTVEDNNGFIKMIERYFSSPLEFKLQHQRSDLNYRAGITPEGVEVPRIIVDKEMQEKMKYLFEENQPSAPVGANVKWRYSWLPNNRSHQQVIPEGFPEWEENMDSWGHKMLSALEVVAEMAAIGFGLSKRHFHFIDERADISSSSYIRRNCEL